MKGVALVQESLANIFGAIAPSALALVVFMFAFSSIVGNYYYGEINVAFFEGDESGVIPSVIAKNAVNIFRVLVLGMIVFGSFAELSLVWDSADLFMGFLCLTNLYALARLGKFSFIALDDYVNQKKKGIAEPIFDPACLPDQKGIHAWKN